MANSLKAGKKKLTRLIGEKNKKERDWQRARATQQKVVYPYVSHKLSNEAIRKVRAAEDAMLKATNKMAKQADIVQRLESDRKIGRMRRAEIQNRLPSYAKPFKKRGM